MLTASCFVLCVCAQAKHRESGQICAVKAMSKGYLISKNQARHAIGERDLLQDCSHPVSNLLIDHHLLCSLKVL